MPNRRPDVGSWYQDAETGSIFEVVAFDEEDGNVEVQHLDGEVEEFDLDSWRQMRIGGIAPPEDWRSGFELSQEDARDPDQTLHPDEWGSAIDQIEPDEIGIEDDWSE
jgi:hypothetical protein